MEKSVNKKSKANLQLEELQRRFQMIKSDLERLREDACNSLDGKKVELVKESTLGYGELDQYVSLDFAFCDTFEFPFAANTLDGCDYIVDLMDIKRVIE